MRAWVFHSEAIELLSQAFCVTTPARILEWVLQASIRIMTESSYFFGRTDQGLVCEARVRILQQFVDEVHRRCVEAFAELSQGATSRLPVQGQALGLRAEGT